MARDNLTVEISPVLLEAIGLSGETGSLDYFQLLGLDRQRWQPADLERGVLDRTKALRPWQNSPQHGEETVRLLPMLHRVASVLRDSARRRAYERELDRLRSGVAADPLDDFREMVRAALADGVVDQASKAELLRYAAVHRIPLETAGRIVNEMAAAAVRPVQPAPAEDAWEMRLAEGGADAFRTTAAAMLSRGTLDAAAADRLIAEAGRYDLDQAAAVKILTQTRLQQFRRLVEHVARASGVLSDNQARLLMPKAAGIGLTPDQAYEVLSGFTYTSASQHDLETMTLTSAGFEASEIEGLLRRQKMVVYSGRRRWAPRLLAGALPKIALGALAAAAIAYAGFQLAGPARRPSPPMALEPRDQAQAPAPAPLTPSIEDSTVTAGPAEEASPEAVSLPPGELEVWDRPKPDPADGFLRIDPETPEDPPPFKIKIHEVTCEEYQEFVLEGLRQDRLPPGWNPNSFNFPAGRAQTPVTGLRWEDALAYCRWLAGRWGLDADRVRPPRQAEFERALRAPLSYDRRVTDEGFWDRARLRRGQPAQVSRTKNDTLYFPEGQVYDLIGNAAEWGTDAEGTPILLGGDYAQSGSNYDPRLPRRIDPTARLETVGFRPVILEP